MINENEITVLDMFSGAGGLSEGFFRNGFKFVAHIEKDKYASKTLETRALYHALKNNNMLDTYYGYLKGELSRNQLFENTEEFSNEISSSIFNIEISKKTEKLLVEQIQERMINHDVPKIDVMIGGPPCQAYSFVGRSRDPDGMINDPRNYLYHHYLSFLKAFKPDFFIFENVPGIFTAKNGTVFNDMIKSIKKMGYVTENKILDAADFFVLQKRKRVILMGWISGNGYKYPDFTRAEHSFFVENLLEDLPSLHPGEGSEGVQEYIKPPSQYLIESGIRDEKDVLIQHHARKHNEQDREIYRHTIKIWGKEKRRIKYSELPEKLKTHENQESFEDRFKVVAGDHSCAHTVVAHISKDGHYYIHPDINQARSLTVREVARIQSFPDNYKFEGPRTSRYAQIGNAVPPLMAEAISMEIRKMF
ncbi:DNA cytosine methyltransferase [Candidatus Methanoperedens nitratireducens]|uniref:DNA (cytosine-5-)-methyltransferase n=1 Tax=Candidatus Methanoperedens nitratireducens TaxID=1392998 RepID=A0A284VMH1_9EURY|nr:DNA cytosine methyltransferase [Candidatus Methanoperedens nitroreducens]SNQ60397.1 Cytosine-specific methyltransferase [Candidatus Methanoperedens nitroreducens]